MNRLAFALARLRQDEAALMTLSLPQAALLAELDGRSVALVGNARALAQGRQGAAIDRHDVVMRMNRAPMPAPASHGTRTDWLALGIPPAAADRQRLSPSRVLWMPWKRRRLDWATARAPGFYLHPRADIAALQARLGAKPTTGALMIDLLLRSRLAALDLHGFDFFASNSLSGRRTAAEVPHDFGAEAKWVAGLVAADPRLRLVATDP